MNRDPSTRLGAYLLDEIGRIDDRYIAEAETEYRPAGRTFALRRVLVLAISLTLALTLGLALFIGNGLLGSKTSDAEKAPNDRYDDMGELITHATGTSAAALSVRLEGLREETESLRVRREDLDLSASAPRIIWKYADEETYRVKTITLAQRTALLNAMEQDAGRAVSPKENGAEQTVEGVWIALGGGSVISPYLEQTAGNTSVGALFDYSPELEPSADFTDTLCGILS